MLHVDVIDIGHADKQSRPELLHHSHGNDIVLDEVLQSARDLASIGVMRTYSEPEILPAGEHLCWEIAPMQQDGSASRFVPLAL